MSPLFVDRAPGDGPVDVRAGANLERERSKGKEVANKGLELVNVRDVGEMYEKGSHFDMAINNLEAIIIHRSFGSRDNKEKYQNK